MRYNNRLNYRARKRFLFRVRLAIFVFALLVAASLVYMFLSIRDQDSANIPEVTTSEATSSYFAPSVKIFRSPFFQFQTDQTWAEVPTESSSNKFVYRSLRSNLIEHELSIYVNQIPANLTANRSLPVTVINSKELVPSRVSELCNKVFGGQPRLGDQEVEVDKVRIRCNADGTNYEVLVGAIGGSSTINMIRPDGTPVAYALQYTNLKATGDVTQLTSIIESFQTR